MSKQLELFRFKCTLNTCRSYVSLDPEIWLHTIGARPPVPLAVSVLMYRDLCRLWNVRAMHRSGTGSPGTVPFSCPPAAMHYLVFRCGILGIFPQSKHSGSQKKPFHFQNTIICSAIEHHLRPAPSTFTLEKR